MVDFLVFNELSLPFDNKYKAKDGFKNFLEVLKILREKNIQKIRMDKDFKEYEIIKDIYLQEFFRELDSTFKDRFQIFLANDILKIETPLIKDDEIGDVEDYIISTYKYEDTINNGGLAVAHFWNTIAMSFDSNTKWDNYQIGLKKDKKEIKINHISKQFHIEKHNSFFDKLEEEVKLGIKQDDFWDKKEELFSKIKFVDEVEKQVKELDKMVFCQAVSILRDIETNRKILSDFTISGEGETVRTNPDLKSQREFKVNGKKEFFEKHIKNLSNGHRIHFLEKKDEIYIGYIGKHLSTKNIK
jgi:hypothetical protein